MKEHVYYILLSLSRGARHGFAITRDVLEFSGGQRRLWPATLYGTLQELVGRGWIQEIDAGDAKRPDGSERKRYYGITRKGQSALDAETRRLSDLVRLARSVARRGSAPS